MPNMYYLYAAFVASLLVAGLERLTRGHVGNSRFIRYGYYLFLYLGVISLFVDRIPSLYVQVTIVTGLACFVLGVRRAGPIGRHTAPRPADETT